MDLQPLSTLERALRDSGAYIFFHDSAGMGAQRGHLTLMLEPERVAMMAVNFWKMTLLDDAEAATWFKGADCKMCTQGTIPELKAYDFGSRF